MAFLAAFVGPPARFSAFLVPFVAHFDFHGSFRLATAPILPLCDAQHEFEPSPLPSRAFIALI